MILDLHPIWHYILNIVTSEWFGSLVAAPLIAWLVDKLLRSRRKLKQELVKQMLQIQKQHPDWDGEEKKDMVVDAIISRNVYAKRLPREYLESIVDAVVAEIKEAIEEEKPSGDAEYD